MQGGPVAKCYACTLPGGLHTLPGGLHTLPGALHTLPAASVLCMHMSCGGGTNNLAIKSGIAMTTPGVYSKRCCSSL